MLWENGNCTIYLATNFLTHILDPTRYDELVLGAMARWRDELHVCRPRPSRPRRSVPQ